MRSIREWLHFPAPIYKPQLQFAPSKSVSQLTFAGPNMANVVMQPQTPPPNYDQNRRNSSKTVARRGPIF